MKELNQHIKEVIENFDFQKVEKIMTVLNWKWTAISRVPDIFNLKAHVEMLMKRAYKSAHETEKESGFCDITSGGFRILYDFCGERDNFNVMFCIETADSNVF